MFLPTRFYQKHSACFQLITIFFYLSTFVYLCLHFLFSIHLFSPNFFSQFFFLFLHHFYFISLFPFFFIFRYFIFYLHFFLPCLSSIFTVANFTSDFVFLLFSSFIFHSYSTRSTFPSLSIFITPFVHPLGFFFILFSVIFLSFYIPHDFFFFIFAYH